MNLITKRKIFIWILLTLNLLFAYIIGYSIPRFESEFAYFMGLVLIPLLIILNYIIIDRFYYYIKNAQEREKK